MMSPDPPREDSQEDYLGTVPNSDGFTTLVVFEDDMMGEGEHELDVSSRPESDTSEDEEDDEHYRGQRLEEALEGENEEEGEERFHARGRYQLLIPFNVEHGDEDDAVGSEDDEPIEIELPSPQDPASNSNPGSVSINAPDPDSQSIQHPAAQSQSADGGKREILLSEDKVETIKNVMKGFSLPEAAIPGWAKNLSEESWKTKLVDAISVDGVNKNKKL